MRYLNYIASKVANSLRISCLQQETSAFSYFVRTQSFSVFLFCFHRYTNFPFFALWNIRILSRFPFSLFFRRSLFIRLYVQRGTRVRSASAPLCFFQTALKAKCALHASLTEDTMSSTFRGMCENARTTMLKNALRCYSIAHQGRCSEQSLPGLASAMMRSSVS